MNVQRGVLLAGYGVFPSMYMGISHGHVRPEQNESPFETEGGREWKLYTIVDKVNYLVLVMLVVIVLFFV